MRVLTTALAAVALPILCGQASAQQVLSLDGSRTSDALLGAGDIFLTSTSMPGATTVLTDAGMTISLTDRFVASNIASADVLFTGLVDVPFTAQELADVDAFVSAGGGLVIMRDWGNFGADRDSLAAVFGVTYDPAFSGIAGTATAVNMSASSSLWSGPGGTVTSFSQVFSSSIQSGATVLGTHATDGKAAIGVVEHGLGTVVFLTDTSAWASSSGILPQPSLANARGIVWLNMFRLADAGSPPTATAYCFGDGTGATCPCSAFGLAGEGCVNSGGSGGATLVGTGSATFGFDSFQLDVSGVPGAKPGLILRGDSQVAVPVGDGILCTAGNSQRSQVLLTVAGAVTYTDFNGAGFSSVANMGAPTNFQFWYRDTANPCMMGGFNFTNGVSVTFQP